MQDLGGRKSHMKKFPNKHKSITQWTYWKDVLTVLLLFVSHAAECDIFPQLENLIQCTLYCVLCIMDRLFGKLYTELCTLYSVHCILYTELWNLYIYIVRKRMLWHCFCTLCHKFLHLLLMYKVNRVQFTLYNIHFTPYTLYCTINTLYGQKDELTQLNLVNLTKYLQSLKVFKRILTNWKVK